jgi:hypothetical protein
MLSAFWKTVSVFWTEFGVGVIFAASRDGVLKREPAGEIPSSERSEWVRDLSLKTLAGNLVALPGIEPGFED